MTWRKRILFAGVACGVSLALLLGALLVLDLRLHKRFDQVAGLNIRGYRGPVAGKKQPGEQRIVVLGGSTALGYGVAPDQAFSTYLEHRLNEGRGPGRPVSVVNISGNSEGAYAFLPNLRYYEHLRPDVALFYTGYNDRGGPNTWVFRSQSPVFRLTGYYPIMPLILNEKLMALKYGNVEDGYRQVYGDQKVVFRPSAAAQSQVSLLEAAVHINQAMEQQLERLPAESHELAGSQDFGCGQWNHYCASLARAVDYTLRHGRKALVVTEPYLGEGHIEQQRVMAGMLQRHFGANPNLRYVNLGKSLDLTDPALCYDGMHLTGAGNARIADALLEPVSEVLE